MLNTESERRKQSLVQAHQREDADLLARLDQEEKEEIPTGALAEEIERRFLAHLTANPKERTQYGHISQWREREKVLRKRCRGQYHSERRAALLKEMQTRHQEQLRLFTLLDPLFLSPLWSAMTDLKSGLDDKVASAARSSAVPLKQRLDQIGKEMTDLKSKMETNGATKAEVLSLRQELMETKRSVAQLETALKTKASTDALEPLLNGTVAEIRRQQADHAAALTKRLETTTECLNASVTAFEPLLSKALTEVRQLHANQVAELANRLETAEVALRQAKQTIYDMQLAIDNRFRESKAQIETRVPAEKLQGLELLMEVTASIPKVQAVVNSPLLTATQLPQALKSKLKNELRARALNETETACTRFEEVISELESTQAQLASQQAVTDANDSRVLRIFELTALEAQRYRVAEGLLKDLESQLELTLLRDCSSHASELPRLMEFEATVLNSYREKVQELRSRISQGLQTLQTDIQTWRVCSHPNEVRATLVSLEADVKIASSEASLLEWVQNVDPLVQVTKDGEGEHLIQEKAHRCKSAFLHISERWRAVQPLGTAAAAALEVFPTAEDVKFAVRSLDEARREAVAANDEFCGTAMIASKAIKNGTLSNEKKVELELRRQNAKLKCSEYWEVHKRLFDSLRKGFPSLVMETIESASSHRFLVPGISFADFIFITEGSEHHVGPVEFVKARAPRVIHQLITEAYDRQEIAIEPLLDETTFAVKSFKSLPDFTREVEAIMSVRHPYVGSFHFCFEDENRYHIVMPKYACTSKKWFDLNRRTATPEVLLRALLQIASGLNAMHMQDLVHSDIKPENIMFTTTDSTGIPKIIDFDCCMSTELRRNQMLLHITKTYTASAAGFVGGTATYLPPEILEALQKRCLNSTMLSPSIDVHCLGKTMQELIFGTTHSDDTSLSAECCNALQGLIREMTQQPENRCGMNTVLKVLGGLLAAIPRPTASSDPHVNSKHVDPALSAVLESGKVCCSCFSAPSDTRQGTSFLTCANGHSHCSACWLSSTKHWLEGKESEYEDAIPCPARQRGAGKGCNGTFAVPTEELSSSSPVGASGIVADLLNTLSEDERARLTRLRRRQRLLAALKN